MNNQQFKVKLNEVWNNLKSKKEFDTLTFDCLDELFTIIGDVPRHGSKLFIHPLDIIEDIPLSQLLTNMLDPSLQIDHRCVCDFDGSSSSMESLGLLYLVKYVFWKSKGKLLVGTIVIDDDTSMKKVVSRGWTLPRGHVNKGGVLPSQNAVPSWFADINYRAKCVVNMVYGLVLIYKELNKLDALRLKNYYQ